MADLRLSFGWAVAVDMVWYYLPGKKVLSKWEGKYHGGEVF